MDKSFQFKKKNIYIYTHWIGEILILIFFSQLENDWLSFYLFVHMDTHK